MLSKMGRSHVDTIIYRPREGDISKNLLSWSSRVVIQVLLFGIVSHPVAFETIFSFYVHEISHCISRNELCYYWIYWILLADCNIIGRNQCTVYFKGFNSELFTLHMRRFQFMYFILSVIIIYSILLRFWNNNFNVVIVLSIHKGEALS
jgi:hypothetical protein